MILSLFYNNTKYLIILAFIFYGISLLFIKYKKKYYPKIHYNNTSKSREEFFQYLDRYYIRNKFYTFLAVGIYFFFQSGWILLYRFIFFNNLEKDNNNFFIDYNNISFNFYNLLTFIFFIGLLIITIVLFKTMLDNLFNDELLKLHFFLLKYRLYYITKYYIMNFYVLDFFGNCYAFFFNISRFNEKYVENDKDEFYYFLYNYRHIYNNKNILALSKKLVEFSKNNKMFHYMIKILAEVFKWLHYNMRFDGLAYYIPYFFLAIVILYNFTHKDIYYGNYLFLLAYLLIQILNYLKFMSKRDAVYSGIISGYFYQNSLCYKKQRAFLKKDISRFYDDMYKSNENKVILHYMKDLKDDSFVNYILNDCISYSDRNIKNKTFMKEFRASHKRYYILSLLTLGVYYIIINRTNYTILISNNIEIPILWIFISLTLVVFYIAINIYKSPRNNLDGNLAEYIYKPRYKIIFWVLVMFFMYLIWLFIIKANIFIISDGILWNNWGITVIRNYTLEIKYIYFYDCLDKILSMLEKEEYGPLLLKDILFLIEELQLKEFITEKGTLNEIKELIEVFIDIYFKKIKLIDNEYSIIKEKKLLIKSIMDCISNITNLIVFSKFFVKYLKAWHIARNIRSYETWKFVNSIIKILINLTKK